MRQIILMIEDQEKEALRDEAYAKKMSMSNLIRVKLGFAIKVQGRPIAGSGEKRELL